MFKDQKNEKIGLMTEMTVLKRYDDTSQASDKNNFGTSSSQQNYQKLDDDDDEPIISKNLD